jgi:hypothetical protein
LDSGQRSRKSILNLPESSTTKVNVMLHETHAAVTRPTLFIVVADYVLIVRIGVFGQESLDQVSAFVFHEAEQYENFVNVTTVESYRVPGFCLNVG